jgi:type II secretory pathway pseudopilin PulG
MFCPQCGESNPDDARVCFRCGKELPVIQAQSTAGNPPPQVPSGVVPYTSLMAIWSLVFGILGFLTFFLPLFGLLGAIFGAMALSRIRKSQGRLTGSTPAIIGLVLSIISLCLFGVVLLFAAIAVPNFLEAQTRSKVSRARNDMRSMATALESYYVDYNKYPASSSNASGNLYAYLGPNSPMSSQPTFGLLGNKGAVLTTPIAYITSIPFDPFAPVAGAPFCYYLDPTGTTWLLWSAGPDKKYDITAKNIVGILNPQNPNMTSNPTLLALTYDPTNGTKSPGDIWRVKQ